MNGFLRNTLLVGVAVLLFFLISKHSLVAYLETVNPEAALTLRGTDTAAKLQIAGTLMATRQEAGDNAPPVGDPPDLNSPYAGNNQNIRDFIASALYAQPLNARAFELLGVLAAEAGDTAAAARFMQAAAQRSLRSPAALYWLMQRKVTEGNTDAAVTLADTLLRIRPSAVSIVGRTLAEIASSPRGVDDVVAVLAKPAPWRSNFLRFLNADVGYGDRSLKLLVGLRTSAHPPTEQEIDAYVWSLAINHEFELAYYAWLQFLPPEKARAASLLFNGNFRFNPSPVPFDWTMPGGNGVISEIAEDDSLPGNNVLWIELGGGRVNFGPISELLVLEAGRYSLSGLSKGKLDGPRGLKWQVACIAPASALIAETPMMLGDISQWAQFSMRFEVPAGCAAQSLRLILDARSLSETLVSGTIAFADLKIVRD